MKEEQIEMEEWILERLDLAKERLAQIPGENTVKEPFGDFFNRTGNFLLTAVAVLDHQDALTLDEGMYYNQKLYEDILPENYGESYGNPEYAEKKLGEYGKLLSFLYAELRGAIPYAYEKKLWDMTVVLELFLEVYAAFEQEEIPSIQELHRILQSYVEDYCQEMVEERVHSGVDPEITFATDLIMNSDLTDPAYLYRFGEYISDNEIRTAMYLNSLPEEEIRRMASVFTEGYRIGFEVGGKDIRKKKTVKIEYHLGFERMIRQAILNFKDMGLSSILQRHVSHVVNKRNQHRRGYTGAVANPQYDYDHRSDQALFLSQDFVKRKLRSTQEAYEKYKKLALVHGGPAVMETFGENPFSPDEKASAYSLTDSMKKLQTELDNELGQITNRYIKGEERSFTIIAWPLPEIGENYEKIFDETVKINTLDYKKYQTIQQKIIDTLDTCEWVEIKGKGDNETDLLIHLHELKDPQKQTNFENCVADVNIPVGEVFTSPVLAGTGGILHVEQVYLEGLLFKNLKLIIDCGQVIDYSCENFEDEEKNRRYIEDNILFHHPKIPMGEFAIGTNTTAYVAARKYDFQDKLPILIAEKTGPHFAFGDTCYSWQEDNAVYNPDGKEIIARDNEISEMRLDDLSLAYFNCHTDITIPYDELDSIRVIDEEGEMISIIEDGRFVLSGTEELNEPFAEL